MIALRNVKVMVEKKLKSHGKIEESCYGYDPDDKRKNKKCFDKGYAIALRNVMVIVDEQLKSHEVINR